MSSGKNTNASIFERTLEIKFTGSRVLHIYDLYPQKSYCRTRMGSYSEGLFYR